MRKILHDFFTSPLAIGAAIGLFPLVIIFLVLALQY